MSSETTSPFFPMYTWMYLSLCFQGCETQLWCLLPLGVGASSVLIIMQSLHEQCVFFFFFILQFTSPLGIRRTPKWLWYVEFGYHGSQLVLGYCPLLDLTIRERMLCQISLSLPEKGVPHFLYWDTYSLLSTREAQRGKHSLSESSGVFLLEEYSCRGALLVSLGQELSSPFCDGCQED